MYDIHSGKYLQLNTYKQNIHTQYRPEKNKKILIYFNKLIESFSPIFI